MCFFLSEYYIMVSLLVPRAAFSALNTKAKEIRGFFFVCCCFFRSMSGSNGVEPFQEPTNDVFSIMVV